MQYTLLKAFGNGHLFFEEAATGAVLVADQSINQHCFLKTLDPTKTDDGRLEVDLSGIDEVTVRPLDRVATVPVITDTGKRAHIIVPQRELDFLKSYARGKKAVTQSQAVPAGRKKVVVVLEYDDPDDDMPELSDVALWIDVALQVRSPEKKASATVYDSIEAATADEPA